MARAAGKKTGKPAPQVSPSAAQQQTISAIPDPFHVVPATLRPLVSKLPTNHVYAIHVDTTPVSLKQRVYVVPILLNMAISVVLAWRVYYAAPAYLEQIITIFGYDTPWKVEPAKMAFRDIVSTVSDRTFMLMFDYAIFALLGSWPWQFLFGSKYSRYTGPASWRWALGFRPKEIIVRQGRKWDQALLVERDDEGEMEKKQKWTLDEELSLKFKVEEAMRKSYTAKTGYLLLDKFWDLDFKAMLDAQKLIEKGDLKEEDVDHIVLVFYQKQWLIWRVHASSEAAEKERVTALAGEDSVLKGFQAKLTSLGVEDIFFRWIEIIQYESSLPGGFTLGKQAEAMRELKRLLVDRGVDYAKFWKDIGGQDGVPGLEHASS